MFRFFICATMLLGALAGGRCFAEDKGLKDPKVAVQFTFNGPVTEQSDEDNPFAMFNSDVKPVGLREWSKRIERAAASDRVAGVFLVIDSPMISWTHALALRDEVLKLRKAGRPVIAYAEQLDGPQFLLAAAADKVFLSPAGELFFISGLTGRQYFLKGALDKFGIQADLHHIGTHKGAAEPLTLTQPSKESQEMMNWLLDDWYAQFCEQVGQARGKDAAAGKAWLDGGPYSAQQALAAGLVDGLKTRIEAIDEFKTLAGVQGGVKIDRKFGEKTAQTVDFSNSLAIFSLFSKLAASTKQSADDKPAVGLIYLEGPIVSGNGGDGAEEIASLSAIASIEKARKDDTVKAVVLRINSPGGSALASDEIAAAISKLKAAKPVVVSVGSVAGSGGYYISAAAERIFVAPTSLVGSIGVVGGKLVFKGLYDWLGVTTYKYHRGGENADLFDETQAFTDSQQKWFMENMKEIYEKFVKVVKDGRGNKLKDFETKITGGKVFTGRQAIENGLADELGGLDKALAFAATRGGLPADKFEVRELNKRENFAQKFIKKLSGDEDDDDVSTGAAGPKLSLPGISAEKIESLLGALAATDRDAAAAIAGQLRALSMLQRESVLLVSPFEISVKP